MKTLSDTEEWLESYETFTAADLRAKSKLLCYIRRKKKKLIAKALVLRCENIAVAPVQEVRKVDYELLKAEDKKQLKRMQRDAIKDLAKEKNAATREYLSNLLFEIGSELKSRE